MSSCRRKKKAEHATMHDEMIAAVCSLIWKHSSVCSLKKPFALSRSERRPTLKGPHT